MIKITFWTGSLLIVLGVNAFVLTGSQSITALIPLVFGILMIICARVAQKERIRKTAMHVAQGLALLGLLGSISGLIKVLMFVLSAGMLDRPSAAIAQTIMAVICLIYLILGIQSFIKARKEKI